MIKGMIKITINIYIKRFHPFYYDLYLLLYFRKIYLYSLNRPDFSYFSNILFFSEYSLLSSRLYWEQR